MNNENISMNKYKKLEEKLKDDIRDVKVIRQIGRELISKMKLIDEEINIINPNKFNFSEVQKDEKDKLCVLYSLRQQYSNKLDMILVILNQENRISYSFMERKLEEVGLDNKFLINDSD